jgi:hypothetical protein
VTEATSGQNRFSAPLEVLSNTFFFDFDEKSARQFVWHRRIHFSYSTSPIRHVLTGALEHPPAAQFGVRRVIRVPATEMQMVTKLRGQFRCAPNSAAAKELNTVEMDHG